MGEKIQMTWIETRFETNLRAPVLANFWRDDIMHEILCDGNPLQAGGNDGERP